MVWKSGPQGRLAKSLITLIDQVDAKWPVRDRSSDGTIGDARHQATKSEHNADENGVVRALDISNDPAHGVVSRKIAQALLDSRDPRILYVISNGEMARSYPKTGTTPWQWSKYSGINDHTHHCHISVVDDESLYDDTRPWSLDGKMVPPKPVKFPVPTPKAPQRTRMAKTIVDYEARRQNGHLAVYDLPANDGGGTYEVAGINDRYHPTEAALLKGYIDAGRYSEAEAYVTEFIAQYTDVVRPWHSNPGVEFYLRDCAFNRGPGGAARILQLAVGVPDDGRVGPATRTAVARLSVPVLLAGLRTAREEYELRVAGRRANLWQGLVNRWDKALAAAKEFAKEKPERPGSAGPVVVGTGGAGTSIALFASGWIKTAVAVAVICVVGAIVWHVVRKRS